MVRRSRDSAASGRRAAASRLAAAALPDVAMAAVRSWASWIRARPSLTSSATRL